MDQTEKYLRLLLQQQGITIDEKLEESFQTFVDKEENRNHVKSIRFLQDQMTKNWKLIARRHEIDGLQLILPNATVGKPYVADFKLSHYGLEDLVSFEWNGFENSGLNYNKEKHAIEGIPIASGDLHLSLTYKLDGELDDEEPNRKKVTIIVNPDPKSLWKNLPSNANDPYAKPDEQIENVSLLNHTFLAASKRGRSHANIGSFRDDDYAYASLADGWAVIAIADGAGSATYSRQGSKLACDAIIQYFNSQITSLLTEVIASCSEHAELKTKLMEIARPHLAKAVKKAHNDIAQFALSINATAADFHTTLAFVLIKEISKGYVFLSFAVGDCPIALIDKDFKSITSLHSLDVGEYGGGTRFITMPDIFTNNNFESRFNVEVTASFPYLVLMTDGIYDSKFEVEANLVKPEKWAEFFADLSGNNEEKVDVLSQIGTDTTRKFSNWMDFWSPGNHDDRTLILMF